MRDIPTSFEVIPYGDFEPVTPLVSKGRVRIYYLGANRNLTYITPEFSAKLESSLPYTPVVGIYMPEEHDFKSHSLDRNEARVYGLVPENPNIAWENFMDTDGIVRSYLCCDVYLYTGRYEAARDIIGKAQSMELNSNSIEGNWELIDGTEYYVFTNAFFDGLCVLGNRVEPCFEGAAFFTQKDFEVENAVVSLLEKYVRSKTNNIGEYSINGGIQMDEKEIVSSIEETSEETVVETVVEPVVETLEENEIVEEKEDEMEPAAEYDDDPKPVEGGEGGSEEGGSNEGGSNEGGSDESGSSGNGSSEGGSDEGNNEEEDTSMLGDGYDGSDPMDDEDELGSFEAEEGESIEEPAEDLGAQILELEERISTLETEVSNVREERDQYKARCEAYELAEQERLLSAKKSMLAGYSNALSESAIADIERKMGEYASVEELEKDILYSINKEKPLIHRQDSVASYSTIGVQSQGGIIGILNNYKKRNETK